MIRELKYQIEYEDCNNRYLLRAFDEELGDNFIVTWDNILWCEIAHFVNADTEVQNYSRLYVRFTSQREADWAAYAMYQYADNMRKIEQHIQRMREVYNASDFGERKASVLVASKSLDEKAHKASKKRTSPK